MKTHNAFLFIILLIGSSLLLGKEEKQQVVYVPVPVTDPIERDKIVDKALFAQFMSVLGNFCHILMHRHNPERVMEHVSYIIKDVVTAADIVTRNPKNRPELLKKCIQQILIYLIQRMQQEKIVATEYRIKNLVASQ